MVVSHVEIFNVASIELLWWLFVIPVLNIMWTLYNFWANLILSNVGSDVFFRSCDFFQKRKVAFFLSWRSRCCSKSQCRFASIFWKKQSPSLQWCFIYPTESFDVNDIVSAKFLSYIYLLWSESFTQNCIDPFSDRAVSQRVVHLMLGQMNKRNIHTVFHSSHHFIILLC